MYYTSLKRVSTSLKYSKNMDRAFKQAKSEDMAIKPGSGSGDYVLESRKTEILIREHDSLTDTVLRECDPEPYLMATLRSDFKGDPDKRLETLIRYLNRKKVSFDDVIAAAKEAKKKAE